MGGIGELGVSKIDDLVEDLVDEYKILADDFLVDGSAEVLDDDDDPVEQFEDVGGGDVEAGGRHHVDGGLLQVGEIDALYVEDGLDVPLRQLHLAVEQLGRVLYEVGTEVSIYYRISTRRQEKYLGNHKSTNYKLQ